MSGIVATDDQIARLQALGGVLMPEAADMPAAAGLDGFDGLLRTAVRACGYTADDVASAIEALPADVTWESVKSFAAGEPDLFGVATTLVTAAYYMAPSVLGALKFPVQRQHPAGVEDFVEEYETGILDPVTERGPRFRLPDAVPSR